MRNVLFRSFSSGSCGNCYFLGLEEDGAVSAGVLIDAGVSLRRLKTVLESSGMGLDSFSDILVTHDHLDHIRALGSYCKRLRKPVWGTPVLLDALSHHTFTLDHIAAVRKSLSDEGWNEIVPGKIKVKYFVVPHDATQTVGYGILVGDYPFVIMTDVGAMTDEALTFAANARTVVIESNYDVDMLMSGPYTHELKMRICQGHGHLSNDECAAAIKCFWHEGLDHIFLCHLSENNNTPKLAYSSASAALEEIGAENVRLHTLPRRTPSDIFRL